MRKVVDVLNDPDRELTANGRLGRADSFEQLIVWQEAHALVLAVYQLTASFPSDERYGLVTQMRRAAVSVPANVAEGFKRRGPNDKCRFYNIAQASLEELSYYFILSRDLEYASDYQSLRDAADRIGRMLTRLIQAVQR